MTESINTKSVFQHPVLMDERTARIAAVHNSQPIGCIDDLKLCMRMRIENLMESYSYEDAKYLTEELLEFESYSISKETLVEEVMSSDQMAAVITDLCDKCAKLDKVQLAAYQKDPTQYNCHCAEEEFKAMTFHELLENLADYVNT